MNISPSQFVVRWAKLEKAMQAAARSGDRQRLQEIIAGMNSLVRAMYGQQK